MAGYQERLIAQFEDWVVLGSGLLPPWDDPVTPEPPFRPFPGYTMRMPEGLVDDGRRHTGISSSLESLHALTSPPPSAETEEDDWDGTPLEDLLDHRSEIVELQIMPPPNCAISASEFEYFLYSLAPTRFPICFEIVATGGSIVLQLCCDPDDARFVVQCIEAHLPKLDVVVEDSFLLDQLVEQPDHAIASGDLALDQEFILPIRGLRDFGCDPYQGILACMAGLNWNECAVLQINFKACVQNWSDNILSLVTSPSGTPVLGPESKELVNAAHEKTRKPLFAATMRISAFAESEERAAVIANMIASSLSTYTERNGFCIAEDDERDADQRKIDVVLRQFRRSGMILNADELCSLVHIPGKDVHAPNLVRQTERTAPAPETADESRDLILGLNQHRGSDREVGLTIAERTKHIHVMGASGTGKSTFLLNCILQDIDHGHGCALLDPHGDLAEGVLNHLPEHRIQDVVLFDPADEDFPVGFNMLSARSEVEKNLLSSDFVSIFRRLSSAWGDQMTAVLGNATLAILESPNGGTLIDLRRFLVEKGFRHQFLKTVQDPEVLYFWQNEFPLLKGNTQVSLLTRLNSFLRQKLIRNMVAQDGRKLDFADIMDSGKIFLAPLSQGLIGQENSWLLGSLLVSKFYQIALARQTQAESSRRPFWLYIDEAHNFITASIASILSGTRKYGLGLVLAHQELDQFGRQDAAVLSSILTNSHTRVCFRVGDHDARKLQEGFEHFESEDLRKLKVGRAICRIGGSDQDFNLVADPPRENPGGDSAAKKARDYSRSQYATPREEVEKGVYEQTAMGAAALKEEASKRRPRKTAASKEDPIQEVKIPPRPATAPSPDPDPVPAESEAGGPQGGASPPETEGAPETQKTAAGAPSEPPPPPAEAQPDPVEAESPPPAKSAPKVIPAAAHYKKGRGGHKHKALQEQIKQHANGLGFRASIEAELPDKSGSVDVLLETQTSQIAIEVALKSPIDQEVRNIAKALEYDIPRIVVVSDNSTHLGNIREAAEHANLGNLNERVRFIHEDEIGEFLNGLRASIPDSETSTRGYKVKTKYNKLSEHEMQSRKEALHRAVNDAERRLGGEERE